MKLYLGAPFKHVNRMGPGYALAHEMKDHNTIELYRRLPNLILDNGADELGTGLGGARLTYLAGRLEPEYIILPDVLHKEKKTRKRSLEFYENMKDTGYNGKYMAVIQAKTLDQGLESYAFWTQTGIVDTVGVTYDTKITINGEQSSWEKRLRFLNELVNTKMYDLHPLGIHMLGTLDVAELYKMTRNKNYEIVNAAVTSHDTTSPFACPTRFLADKFGIRFGRAKDWRSQKFDTVLADSDYDRAYWNVACYLAACKVPLVNWRHYIPLDLISELWERLSPFYE